MDHLLKRRVIGALLTVIAVVIILPVVLDSSRHSELVIDMPAMPDVPDWALVQDEQRVRIELQQLASGEAAKSLVFNEPEQISKDDPAPSDVAPDRGGLDAQQQPYAWVLQLGAFAEVKNAHALRDRLRNKGFKAYTEASGGYTRVLVGPEVRREDIVTLQQRVKAELKQNDVPIKRYQPAK